MRTVAPCLILLLFACCALNNLTGCKSPAKESEKNAKAYTNPFGAAEYEFNMIKNPVTGKVPNGSFEGERLQAEAIAQQNRIAGGTPYAFQGPENLGGRTRTLVYDVRYNGTTIQTMLSGGVSGGVYKSTDNGATWVRKSPTGEHYSCTSIAQDPRVGSQNTWYYTVGEALGNSASDPVFSAFYLGNGVYKSTDNGETWSRRLFSNTTPLEQFDTNADLISKVVVNPITGHVYIACVAAILRSTDGGASWGTVLNGALSSSSQMTDIAVTSTGIFYAAFAGSNSVGIDGVWTSTTGASGTWTRIAFPGTPAAWNANGAYGRVVLAIAPNSENIVYALYSLNPEGAGINGELFKYDASGPTPTWTALTLPDEPGAQAGNDPFTSQGGYDLTVAVKPDAPNAVFIGGTNAYRSIDGGLNWTRIGGYVSPTSYAAYLNSHPDIHGFAFQPGATTTMICYNDGGIQRTIDNLAATVAWTQINNGYRTYQFYYAEIDPRTGNNKVIGGAQDNGTVRNTGGTGSTFEPILSGDGVSVGLNVPIAGVQTEFVGFQQGSIFRRTSTQGNGFATAITPTGENDGSGLFVTLFKLDPDNTTNLYYANDNLIYRTATATTVTTTGWTSMTGVGTTVGAANDVTALATTRGAYAAGTSSLFMGTSNGRVYRLDNPINTAAATVPVDITGTIGTGYISSIAVNPRNDDTVLVTLSNYGVTSVYWSGNANTAVPTWTAVEGVLTLPSYRSSAIVVTPTAVEYFVGTSAGLYNATGLPGATAWAQESSIGMGNAVIASLALRTTDNTLLVGTHGYGMWKTQLAFTVVPVTLTEFTGIKQDNTGLLQWATSSEINSRSFEIEKSLDGISFRKIATVAAAGNSSTIMKYQYIDKGLSENNYYRLKSVDQDGKAAFSKTVLIKDITIAQGVVIEGNPFVSNISLRLFKKAAAAGVLKLLDPTGRVVGSQQTAQGAQQLVFVLPTTLARGTYYLRAEIDGRTYTSTIMKK